MDPDVVTNCPQSDHRKSKFELRHGIKLGVVFFMTESEFDFRKTFVIDVFLTKYRTFQCSTVQYISTFHRQVPAAQTRTPADRVVSTH